ncbi:MAG: 7-cyano-7-deazaguanine synthase QueC [Crocosphaera sp.]
MSKVVVLLSGGIDSATVAAKAMAECHEVIALMVRYDQRNVKELASAEKIVFKLGIKQSFVVEVNLGQWGGSALTSTSEDNSSDYVPGRNTVFIAIALSLAQSQGAAYIYLGFNAADTLYPDTTQAYIDAFNQLIQLSPHQGATCPQLIAPLLTDDKVSIIRQALALGVPLEDTWSCYAEEEQPCGLCNACRVRDFALIKAGRPDLATVKGREFYAEGSELTTRLFWRFMSRG